MERTEVFPTVVILILNWNGWQDTIECLETVTKQDYPNLKVVVLDNGSSDDSIEKILAWAQGKIEKINTKFPELVFPLTSKPIYMHYFPQAVSLLKEPKQGIDQNGTYFLIALGENLGFARGMNFGIDFAMRYLGPQYIVLLNNDTVLDRKAMSALIEAFNAKPDIAVAQSTIYYYDHKEKIANAGGKILPWGQHKYYRNIKPNEMKKVTFINGCAMCLPRGTIEKYGKLTEKFFFGEEDFEFSLRMKKNRLRLISVANSIVYHKIGASSQKHWEGYTRRVVIFALNRLVDMREYYSKPMWQLWRILSIAYFWALMLFKNNTPFFCSLQVIKKIFKYSKELKHVHKNEINAIIDEIGIN